MHDLNLEWHHALGALGCLALLGCGSSVDAEVLYEPWIPDPGPRQPAFLTFPSAYDGMEPAPIDAPTFPERLSETGAFTSAAALEAETGLVPYEIQAPLWSDGAEKRRWLSLPPGSTLGYSEQEPYEVPAGTVFIKHFEVALDERAPEQRRRLETRFWIVASRDAQYGVTYKWNDEQTDADLVREPQSEVLTIVGPDGEERTQSHLYPGPGDCHTCHTRAAGFVLGARTAQLNRAVVYRADRPAVEQLVAWSAWGVVDARLDQQTLAAAPQLAALGDDSRSVEDRVRSYWDGNCAMCHAGEDGVVPGWDARYGTALEDQGLDHAPQRPTPATRLIAPGAPEDSFIYLRGATTEPGLLMPPLGRDRSDAAYLELLSRWITELGEAP